MSQLYDWIEQQYKQRSDLKEAANYDWISYFNHERELKN
jgi:hypothetical protein